jgi:phosphonate transport system ATP-binding protein
VIQVHDLGKRYQGGAVALRGVSLAFEPGRLTVLLGPSGAGKSTLLRCLNLLTQPSSGTVVVDGLGVLDSADALRAHRRQTGMVHQHHQLIGRQSALRNTLVGRLAFYSALRTLWPLPREDQRIALAALDRVGLLSKALTRVDRLSGGERQRVGVARALAQRPQVLLADEPVASLDPASTARIAGLMAEISHRDGLTAILSLHQVEVARAFADRIVGLADGRVVFDGAPADLDQRALARIYDHQPAHRAARDPNADRTLAASLEGGMQ